MLVGIFLAGMIVFSFKWMFSKRAWMDFVFPSLYMLNYRIAIAKLKLSLHSGDSRPTDDLVYKIATWLYLARETILAALLLSIVGNSACIPFGFIFLAATIYDVRLMGFMRKEDGTRTLLTISHACHIYERLFYMTMTAAAISTYLFN